MYNIDSFFLMGKSHKVCEDYAVHTNDVVIISDGCSSAPDTDVGSRILARAILSTSYEGSTWRDVLNKAKEVVAILNLPPDCLCATVLTLTVEEPIVRCSIAGDGMVVSRRRMGGELEFFNLTFTSGAPAYLIYEEDDRKKDFLEQYGDGFAINGVVQPKGYYETYPEGLILEFPIEEYDLVAIMSDGVNSFQENIDCKIRNIPSEEVAKQFLEIKGYAGEFIQRRCRAAFKKYAENDVSHYDDFSIGVIKL